MADLKTVVEERSLSNGLSFNNNNMQMDNINGVKKTNNDNNNINDNSSNISVDNNYAKYNKHKSSNLKSASLAPNFASRSDNQSDNNLPRRRESDPSSTYPHILYDEENFPEICDVITSMELGARGTRSNKMNFVDQPIVRNIVPDEPQANWRMYLCVFFSGIGAIIFGLDQGNFGNLQSYESFQRHWCVGLYGDESTCFGVEAANNEHWQNDFITWAAVLISFGSAGGCLFVAPIAASNLGRRGCMTCGCLITMFGTALTSTIENHNVHVFFLGRFITGMGVGVITFVLPIYNAELAPKNIRGRTGSLFQLNVVIGGFIATLITYNIDNWKIALALPAFPAVILAIGIWFCPESPRWLMKTHGLESAAFALRNVREGDVNDEMYEIRDRLHQESMLGKISVREMFESRSIRKRVLIASALQAAQQLSGINIFLSFASTIYAKIGLDDPLLFNCIFNAIMILGVLYGLFMLDKSYPWAGRRRQLIIAAAIMGPMLFLAGLCLLLEFSDYVIMVVLCVFGFTFQTAYGPIPWIYPSELFEFVIRENAMGIVTFWQYIFNAVVVLVGPRMYGWSVGWSLLIYAFFNICNLILSYGFIEETRGVSLENIPKIFLSSGRRRFSCKYFTERLKKFREA